MSPDRDPFEQDLAARMEAAAAPVTGDGVTREAIDRRLAGRQQGRRRRQGGLALAAAAVVLILGLGVALASSGDDGTDDLSAAGSTSEAGDTSLAPTADGSTTDAPTSITCETSLPGGDAPRPTGGCPTSSTTTEAPPTSDGPGATLGPNCTVGTIPPGRQEPGCDRLYSPFVGPGQDCTEGQAPECIDPDGDGRYTWIIDGGQCLVERLEPELCLDSDGDGVLDQPLGG